MKNILFVGGISVVTIGLALMTFGNPLGVIGLFGGVILTKFSII